MNPFDTRLVNNLFPETPASFEKSVHKALKKAGVEKSPYHPWKIVSIAAAAAAVAATFILVLVGTLLTGKTQQAASPDPETGMTAPPHASAEPDWEWNTPILAAEDPNRVYVAEDLDSMGKAILSFLHEIGESEPDELWILRTRSVAGLLPENDTRNLRSCVLVLAQSRFEPSDGPDLYLISGHPDGEVLWCTDSSAPGPHRVLAEVYGQQRWFFYGSNTTETGAFLGHITAGYLTGGEPGTDVEFGAFLSTERERTPFYGSKHLDRLSEYYLVTDGSSDLERALTLSLLLVTEDSNYLYPIRTHVAESERITAEDAAAIRKNIDALTQPRPTPTPVAGTVVTNLCSLDDREIAHYADAVLAWLRAGGTEPQTLWLCGYAPFAFSEEDPTDEAYLLAQYEFDGETGPELFLYRDGTILWQTNGYDPYAINTVYDPIKGQNCVFGMSPYYDNGPVPVKEAMLSLSSDTGAAHWASQDGISFAMELPLEEVLSRVNAHTGSACEFFLCPYPKDMTISKITFVAQNGDTYSPAVDTVKHLAAQTVPKGTD